MQVFNRKIREVVSYREYDPPLFNALSIEEKYDFVQLCANVILFILLFVLRCILYSTFKWVFDLVIRWASLGVLAAEGGARSKESSPHVPRTCVQYNSPCGVYDTFFHTLWGSEDMERTYY